MFRSWLPEWRGGLTATALGLVLAVGTGLMHYDNSVALILGNLVPYLALALVVVALALLILRARWRSFVFGLVGVSVLASVAIALAPYSRLPTGGKHDLSVISFNLLASNAGNGNRIVDYLSESGADVVVIAEADPIVPHLDRLAEAYPYQAGCETAETECGDVLVLSRYRLDNLRVFFQGADSRHQSIEADIVVRGQKVRLLAVHLLRTDYGSLQINELQKLGARIARVDGPAIVAGDFNAAPWIGQFTDMLQRSGLNRATIEPGTWPVMFGPLGVPIDHILVKEPAQIASLDVLADSLGSNHRGLRAEIVLEPDP